MSKFVMANDFIIPKGYEVTKEPPKRTANTFYTVSVLVATSKDTTAELTMDWEEALKLGLIEEQT